MCAAYHTHMDIKEIHATRQERLDALHNIVWTTPLGTQLKGVCAWYNPLNFVPGTLHKEGYTDDQAQHNG